jgi:hypothetical protein
VTAALTDVPVPVVPRLLLDSNVFRDLAEGNLRPFEGRLLRLAEIRTPPVLWTCPLVVDEIACHIRVQEAAKFADFRRALLWMERLCGNLGMAEDLSWVRRRAVFADVAPYEDRDFLVRLNRVRRLLLKAERFDQVPPELLEMMELLRANYTEEITGWTSRRADLLESARKIIKPGQAGKPAFAVIADAIVRTSRKCEEPFAATWGAFRSWEEQKTAQSEVIAFELAQFHKARDHHKYKVHPNDHNDGWLCAYTGAGYLVVTSDGKLRRALLRGGCKDPRVLDLGAALDRAEASLSGSSR